MLIPANVTPEEALNDNKRFAVVWTVLNALRAHDDRFSATVNKIDLNRHKPTGGGPVLIGEMAGEAMSLGVLSYLLFLALISVNLGILNLLPVPMLDGGHLLFYCYEIVMRRKPGKKMKKYGIYVGMAFIFGLTFFALGNDITRLLQ